MNINEGIKKFLTDNYSSIEWDDNTKSVVLNGEETDVKALRIKMVASMVDENPDMDAKDIPLTSIKGIVKQIGRIIPKDDKFNKEKFLEGKPEWYAKLLFGKDGIKSSQTNVEVFLEESEIFKDSLYYDSFAERIMFRNEPYITSKHFSLISQAVEVNLGFNSRYYIEAAINGVALRHKVNPVLKAVEKLRWDGEERLERYFVDIVGAPDTKLTHRITRNFFYALMHRLYNPGAPFSGMPILQDSTQGTGKTEIFVYLLEPIERMVGYKLVDKIEEHDIDNKKDLIHKIKSKWVMVFDECNALLKGDDAWLKSFITERQDEVRLSYEREPQCYLRKCVFIANSNDNNLLKDYTGGVDDIQRRYQIIECRGHKRTSEEWRRDHSEEYKLQILAEALRFYKDNPDFEYLYLPTDMEKEMIDIQSRHKTLNENDDIALDINMILQARIYQSDTVTKYPADAKRFMDRVKEYLQSSNMMETGKSIKRIDSAVLKNMAKKYCRYNQSSQKLTHMMSQEGWVKMLKTINGCSAWYFILFDEDTDENKQIDLQLD